MRTIPQARQAARHDTTRYATVPRLWPGATVVCLGSGPSLNAVDIERSLGLGARYIAINDAYRLAPWADVLYACDGKWWGWHKGAPTFTGLKFTLDRHAARWPGVQVLRVGAQRGLSLDPARLCTGHTSGYQAINLAVLLGASRIVLLGYDFTGTHFFGSHPDGTRPPFSLCLQAFPTMLPVLAAQGVTVLNATPSSALTAFPRVTLAAALEEPVT